MNLILMWVGLAAVGLGLVLLFAADFPGRERYKLAHRDVPPEELLRWDGWEPPAWVARFRLVSYLLLPVGGVLTAIGVLTAGATR